MNREELTNKLKYSARKYRISFMKRFLKYPFISLRDALITIIFNKILKQKFYLIKKAKTIFNDYMYIVFPEAKDIYYYGGYIYMDPEYRLNLFIIKNIFKEDLVFFDLGAHYGWFSLLVSNLLPQSKVYAFEPDPYVLKILEKNKRPNIEIIDKAVSNKEGKIKFYSRPLLSSGVSTLNIESENLVFKNIPYSEVEVESITLDNFCFKNNIYPDFIKIDVEGAEEMVLKGAEEVLKNHNSIIAIEIWFKPFSDVYKNSVDILKSYGYKIYAINEDGDLENINYDKIDDYFQKLNNYYKKINCGAIYDNLIFKK
ncbi:MAG: hypothetical protein KatS3mg095_1014 [Candidatus Parcubacteria bacterium]|nr:MAG: hypothetical protein KatS3mg095_1014 [Candidatus Parcubacteria bacterium]